MSADSPTVDDPAATTRWLEHVTDTQYNTPITAEE